MKNCPKCSSPNVDDARFCGACGATFPTTSAPYPGSNPPPESSVSSGTKTGVTILTIFIPIVGIIMGIIYMNDPSPEKKAAGKQWLWIGIGVSIFWCIISALAGLGGGY